MLETNAAVRIAAVSLALASVAVLFSIAISQILLGVALAAYLASFFISPRSCFEMPTSWMPLLGYLVWTILSTLLSPPVARHWPQIRKMYVLAILPIGYAVYQDSRIREWLPRIMVIVAALSSIAGIVQF